MTGERQMTTVETKAEKPASVPVPMESPTAANALMQKLTFATWMEAAKFEHVWRIAKLFAASDMVPDHYKRKAENCFIACQMAFRLDIEPFMFMQKSYIVHGKPGIESQLAVALANARGPFRGRIRYEMTGEGDTRSCRAYAFLSDTGDEVSETITVRIAKDMGWWGKKDSLWPKSTDLMLKYRSAMWLVRTVCPEVLMGLYSYEELIDMRPSLESEPNDILLQLDAELDVSAQEQSPAESVVDALDAVGMENRAGFEADSPPRDDANAKAWYAGFVKALGNADSLTEVKELEDTLRADNPLDEDELILLAEAIATRRAEIRAKRGERTNAN